MTEVTTEDPVLEAAPFEDLSKTEMSDHLIDMHGIQAVYTGSGRARLGDNTKATKADMIRVHTHSHEHNSERIITPHVHTQLSAATEDREVADAARDGKPISRKLTNSEISRVSKVVDLDFKALEQEIRQLAADALSGQLDDLRQEWSERHKAGPSFIKDANKIIRKARKRYEKLRLEARDLGVILNNGRDIGQYFNPTYEIDGYDSAVREVKQRNQQELNRALIRLERQRAAAQRQIMMSGVTDVAQELLDEVPSAKQMMVQAAQEQAQIEGKRGNEG